MHSLEEIVAMNKLKEKEREFDELLEETQEETIDRFIHEDNGAYEYARDQLRHMTFDVNGNIIRRE